MLSMQQLEELEARVIKALQLISDLRTENSRLEADTERYKSEAEEARLSLEEKEQEMLRIQNELDDATRQLAELREKEEALEKKVISLLGKMDMLQGGSGSIPKGDAPPSAPSASRMVSEPRKAAPKPAPAKPSIADNDDIVIIDEGASRSDEPSVDVDHDEDEIILLDEDEDEVVIDDDDTMIADESGGEDEEVKIDDDDDFIIIEDDEEDAKRK